ncbi:putative disease resistance protein RGA3 [Papaver somniferum]|uniref:putative disease resistance protein RGA3 n=1 Tax=Papaver somniferum TaxID=3469 RepID=UPI000E705F83|nr:putative disease resistance protein RGA3 [Papaver somniferum]
MAESFFAACALEMVKYLCSVVASEIEAASKVNGDLISLQNTVSLIQEVLEHAEKQQIAEDSLNRWLKRLKDVAYDAVDILDDFSYKAIHAQEMACRKRDMVRIIFSSSNSVVFNHNIARKIGDINRQLDDIRRDRIYLDFLKDHSNLRHEESNKENQETTSSLVDDVKVIGREKDKEKIINMLLTASNTSSHSASASSSSSGRTHADGGVSVIPIVGMGGLGKTALARLIYNEEFLSDIFALRIWVHVSTDFSVNGVLIKVIESITKAKCSEDNLMLIENKINKYLRGKKYLLVLDDLWTEKPGDWDTLRNHLNIGATGSKIIVTTRSNEVALVVRGKSPSYDLSELSDDDCWIILRQRAFAPGGAKATPKLEALGYIIAQNCGGVPLAAKSIGGALYFKKKDSEWEAVTRDSKIWDLHRENQLLPALKLSYIHLSSQIKQCFAYCSLFPKDTLIEKQVLVQLWMAEGFLHRSGKNSDKQIEDVGNEYFDCLLANFLLQDVPGDDNGETHFCKMHHLVHDLAEHVGMPEFSILKASKIDNVADIRRLRLSFDEPTYPKSLENASKLRTFISDVQGEDQSIDYHNFFKNKQFRVLDLQWSGIKELPPSIENMKHLRYLDLSNTKIVELPEFITCLYNLQTLLLRYCHFLQKFPRKKMGSLKCLRYLDVSGSHFEVLPEFITKLSNLRTLKLEDCSYIRELPEDLHQLINLRHLVLSDHGKWNEMPRGIEHLTQLQTLPVFKVARYNGGTSRSSIWELGYLKLLEGNLHISNLQNVTEAADAQKANLQGKQNIGSLMLEWSCRGNVNECTNDSTVMEQLQPNPSLVILKIVGFMGVKFPTWMISSTISSALPNLVEVELKNCYGCQQLPALGQLPSLKVLTISTMDVVQSLGTDFYGEARPTFLSLISFTLHDLPRLRMWEPPSSIYTRGFASTSLPTSLSSFSTSYPCLEKMTVEKCPKLERSHDLTFIRGFFPWLKEYKLDGVMKIRIPYKRYATFN